MVVELYANSYCNTVRNCTMKNVKLKSKLIIRFNCIEQILTKNNFFSRSRNEVMMILRRNPNMDREVLRRKFPDVDIEKLVNTDKIRGHYLPKVQS